VPVKVELDKLVSWREISGLRTYAGSPATRRRSICTEFLREDVGLLLDWARSTSWPTCGRTAAESAPVGFHRMAWT